MKELGKGGATKSDEFSEKFQTVMMVSDNNYNDDDVSETSLKAFVCLEN